MSAPTPPPNQPRNSPTNLSGGLKALFDFNFDTFVTPSIVKIVYMVATALIALATVGIVISALAIMTDGGISVLLGFLLLLAAPIIGIIYLAFARMSLELYYAVIRLSEDVHRGPGRI